ncbi:C-type lectin domain family 9 member A [Galemys pyrenaicus]|uniref:C-type lectin domain family 9 member A n=1 Tax=Galemys pyrenaicus TaxID=202257 RepID=A0A8J5ZPL6_GALPY|nr:C-type lectin domain family 9 member A [Galemys pyrenaicus]
MSDTQEEETYTSLQWDNPPPAPCQERLTSTESSGFQVSTVASKQQEKLIHQERALLNLTKGKRHCELQVKYCQSFMLKTANTWTHRGESCYRVFEYFRKWHGGQEFCRQEGAELLQIENKKEMDFVTGSLKMKSDEGYWVGLAEDGLRRTWLWPDGSSPSPDLLTTRKPQSATQRCGFVKDKSLSADDCAGWKYFVCEKYALRSCV